MNSMKAKFNQNCILRFHEGTNLILHGVLWGKKWACLVFAFSRRDEFSARGGQNNLHVGFFVFTKRRINVYKVNGPQNFHEETNLTENFHEETN